MQSGSGQGELALVGGAEGRYRIQVTGNSGVGKSTLGIALAKLLDVPYIPLDQLFWKPGWQESSTEEFGDKIRQALDQDSKGWVVDGNYARLGGAFIENEATDIIWLDPPLLLYFPRLVRRTFLRLFNRLPPCSPGCPETFKEVFLSKESILWWSLSNHWVVKRRMYQNMKVREYAQKVRRIGGWGSEFRRWWAAVQENFSIDNKSI